ncbi:dihydrodipicolinate reductase [Phytoactinopolyspora mesophila]|uniref:Dihydrodipicolinate reductase n=1 Tax=Phytoactinopolyspora mesophila TaxID=2650750 RepID=A0A7K3M553_9ACTN|nr:dihydrodipicolinate reductase [Phytoactinopolyspora mesophila]NDL58375.1 dihydrodipicolinate reductase [Phytoactinopolyspora mesophila]
MTSTSAAPPVAEDYPADGPVIDVVHVGLGPIGRQVLDFMAGRSRYRTAGAVDINPDLTGRTVNDVLGAEVASNSVRVVETITEVGPVSSGAVAIHCAGSSLERVAPVLTSLMQAGFHVVSTCEELANPWAIQPELAASLDRTAQLNNVVLLGTGVNPGYSMDYLPVVLAASQRSVRAVSVHRVQDAGQRRLPLQRKVGAGLSEAEFAERVREGAIRHVGLPESAWIIDRALNLGCTAVTETLDPIVARAPVPLGSGVIEEGRVLGIDQLVLGQRDGVTLVRLHLQMAVGLDDPRDTVTLDGEPGLESVIRGLHGDSATAAVVVNSLGRVRIAPPGLRTVDEIPAAPVNM